jgi:hypothetical protein
MVRVDKAKVHEDVEPCSAAKITVKVRIVVTGEN